MFFTSNVWCSLRLLQFKTEGQTIQTEHHIKNVQNWNTNSRETWVSLIGLCNPALISYMRKLSSVQPVLFEILEKALCRFTQHYKASSAQTHYVTDLWHGCRILYFFFPKPEQYRDGMILLPLERRKCKWYSRRKWSSTFERMTVLNTQRIWRIKRHFWITSDANFVFVNLMFYSMQSHRWSCNLVI